MSEQRIDPVAFIGTVLLLATPFCLQEEFGWPSGWAWTLGLVLGLLVGCLFVVLVVTLQNGPALLWLWVRVWAAERHQRRESSE